jgi:hypothetical protein
LRLFVAVNNSKVSCGNTGCQSGFAVNRFGQVVNRTGIGRRGNGETENDKKLLISGAGKQTQTTAIWNELQWRPQWALMPTRTFPVILKIQKAAK